MSKAIGNRIKQLIFSGEILKYVSVDYLSKFRNLGAPLAVRLLLRLLGIAKRCCTSRKAWAKRLGDDVEGDV